MYRYWQMHSTCEVDADVTLRLEGGLFDNEPAPNRPRTRPGWADGDLAGPVSSINRALESSKNTLRQHQRHTCPRTPRPPIGIRQSSFSSTISTHALLQLIFIFSTDRVQPRP